MQLAVTSSTAPHQLASAQHVRCSFSVLFIPFAISKLQQGRQCFEMQVGHWVACLHVTWRMKKRKRRLRATMMTQTQALACKQRAELLQIGALDLHRPSPELHLGCAASA